MQKVHYAQIYAWVFQNGFFLQDFPTKGISNLRPLKSTPRSSRVAFPFGVLSTALPSCPFIRIIFGEDLQITKLLTMQFLPSLLFARHSLSPASTFHCHL